MGRSPRDRHSEAGAWDENNACINSKALYGITIAGIWVQSVVHNSVLDITCYFRWIQDRDFQGVATVESPLGFRSSNILSAEGNL